MLALLAEGRRHQQTPAPAAVPLRSACTSIQQPNKQIYCMLHGGSNSKRLGPRWARADRRTGTFAGVTATVASTVSGLAATRWKARSVKGMMWLVAKKGMRRMRIFLPCLMEAIHAIGL
jgi:hypothetical protein